MPVTSALVIKTFSTKLHCWNCVCIWVGLVVISPIVTWKFISEPGLWCLGLAYGKTKRREGQGPLSWLLVGLSFLGPPSSPSQPTPVPLMSSWWLYFPGGKGLFQLDFHPESSSLWAFLEQWRVLVCSLTLTRTDSNTFGYTLCF